MPRRSPRPEGRAALDEAVPEREFSRAFEQALEYAGFKLVYHTYDSRRSAAGFPDYVALNISKKRVLFVELKSERGRIRPEQAAWIAALGHCGQEAYIWRPSSWPEIERVLSRKDGQP